MWIRKPPTYSECGNVRNSQVEEINIGCSPHVIIGKNDNTGAEVAAESNNKKEAVDGGAKVKRFIVDLGISKNFFDEYWNVVNWLVFRYVLEVIHFCHVRKFGHSIYLFHINVLYSL